MLSDALAVIEAAGLESFVPCAASHSGWIAIELRRRFPDRVPALVHFDWMVSEPPEPYTRVIEQLTAPEEWTLARDTLFEIWRAGVKTEAIDEAFDVMAAQGREMWMRSGREIGSEYRLNGSPLAAWSQLEPPPPVLHAFGQPADPEYLASQQEFAAGHPWFHVRRVPALSHFAMLEAATEADAAVFDFLAACGL
jgi:pimeloyl-ACP methyl ester carboxylesterase